MEFELVNKHTDEIIDKKNLSDEIGIGGARTYFIGIKELNPNEFDKLFKVRYYRMSKNPIKWWIEEKAIIDEELKIL